MRTFLALIGMMFVVSATTPVSVSADRMRQWIAPMECVIDYGLPTQEILSESECYELLNPEPETPTPNPNVGGGLLQSDDDDGLPSLSRNIYANVVDTYSSTDLSYTDLVLTQPIKRINTADSYQGSNNMVSGVVSIALLAGYCGIVIGLYNYYYRLKG